jgi:hypothetical protein
MTSIQALHEHANGLAERFQIRVVELSPLDLKESQVIPGVTGPCVIVPPIINHMHYAARLHEMGHIMCARERGHIDDMVQDECDAWAWARQHALFWSETMKLLERTCLGTYLNWVKS